MENEEEDSIIFGHTSAGQIFRMRNKLIKDRVTGATVRWILEDIILDWNMSVKTLTGHTKRISEWPDYIIIEGNIETKKFKFMEIKHGDNAYVLYKEVNALEPWRLYFR